MNDERILLTLQEDISAKLLSEAELDTVNIVLQRKLLTENLAEVSLLWLTKRGGRLGTGILIGMPYITDEAKETGVSDSTIVIPLFVFEHPDSAQTTEDGSGITAEELAMTVRRLLRGFVVEPIGSLFTESKSIVPAEPPGGLTDVICYQLEMRARSRAPAAARVATPTISEAALVVTLACSTLDAGIWFTLDDSFPGVGNLTTQGGNLVAGGSLFDVAGEFELPGLTDGARYIVTDQFNAKSEFTASGATHTLNGEAGAPVPAVKLAAAQIYSEPFTVVSGTVVRFAAYKAGVSGSHAIRRTIT